MLRSSLRGLLALAVSGCTPASSDSAEKVLGEGADIAKYLTRLEATAGTGGFLVIGVAGTEDFLQLTASDGMFELDLPLITIRQRQVEGSFRQLASELQLSVRESSGTDGTEFLDIDLEGPAADAAPTVEAFLNRLYGVETATPLSFLCHGCAPAA
jgi:hypothetical protein